MRRTLKLLFLLLIFQMAHAQTLVGNGLAAIRNSLARDEVSSVVVLRIPDDMEFLVGVTPQYMRQLSPPTKKYTIKMTHQRSQVLMEWMQQAQVARTDDAPDCRWGLLFMNRKGKEVASIFSDRWGTGGNVGGHNVKFSGNRLIDTIHKFVGPKVH